MVRNTIAVTALLLSAIIVAVGLELSTTPPTGTEQLVCLPSGTMHVLCSLEVDLPAGETQLAFDYAAENVEPSTVRLVPLFADPSVTVSTCYRRPDAAGKLFWAVTATRPATGHFRIWYVPSGIAVRLSYALHRAGEATAELRASVTTANAAKRPLEGVSVRLATGLSYQASVAPGTEATQDLFVLRDLPLRTAVVYDEAAYGKQAMSVWTMRHPERAQPLAPGPVAVFDGAEPGSALLGRATMPLTPAGAELRLPVRPLPEYQITGGLVESAQQNAKTDVHHKLALSDTLESYEYAFFNRSARPMDLAFRVHADGDWTVEDSSTEYERVDATTVEWRICAPPAQGSALSYSLLKRNIVP